MPVRTVVCTDDPVWCAREWPTLEVSTRSEVHDLALMAGAEFNILAPSSLSWWGAFLGSPERVIIAPKRWFGPKLAHYPVRQLDPGDGWTWLE